MGQLANGIFVATLPPREQLEIQVNKLLIDDIHITISEGRGCVAEGKAKKKKKKPSPKKR